MANDDIRARIKTVTMNGKQMPYGEAVIPVMSPGLNYAAGVFEGIRAYWNEAAKQLYIFRLDEHLKRLAFSMRVLRFDPMPNVADIASQIVADIRANGYREDTYIRLNAFVDEWGEVTAQGPVSTTIVCRPRPRAAGFQTGQDFCVSSWRRLSDNASPPRSKSTANYLNSRLAGIEAKTNGYHGAIILTERGTVAEGPSGCIFMVRDGRLVTPSVTSGILESVTRDTLMTLGREDGIESLEREIDRTELYMADEVFYCGTGQEIVPIVSVDRMKVGQGTPGPLTRALQQRYDALVRGHTNAHGNWRRPVY
jgi:branched-chain amino acid aminotransferase